jgi:hypothetical protein
MELRPCLAALAAALLISLPAIAEGPAAEQLVEQARALMKDGSRDALGAANKLLFQALEADPRYAPTYVLMIAIQDKLGTTTFDPRNWHFRASKGRDFDAPWLVPYHLAYAEKYAPEEVPKYREMAVKAGVADHKTEFTMHHEAFRQALASQDRARAQAEFVEMRRLEPRNAFIPGDYSRGLMMWSQDFDAGERYAREALSISDYPHARQSLSLALYGKWVAAVRSGASPAEVRALLKAAQANDPDARNVPDCALNWPPMKAVADAIEGLYARRRRDPTLQDC